MSSKKIKDKLGKQLIAPNPYDVIMRGAVARLDAMVEIIDLLKVTAVADADKEFDSPILEEWKDSVETFLTELGVVKLFTGLVLKLQRPLSTNEDVPVILAYNEDRSLMEQLTIDEGVLTYFGDPGTQEEFKVFVFARLWQDGTLQIVKNVEWQDW